MPVALAGVAATGVWLPVTCVVEVTAFDVVCAGCVWVPVAPWVFAIAYHVYLMNRRATGRRLRFEETLAADARANGAPRDEARAFLDADRVERALRVVPEDQRHALLLHHVEGWSFVEIAERLGIRVNAAKTRAFRGVRKMREHLSRRRGRSAKADFR